MSEPIEPALTAEEWAKRQNWVATIGAGNSLIVGPDDCPHWVESVDRHGVAALALYGQSFGFTREEAHHLRYVAERTDWPGLSRIVEKIEALLPPE